MFRSGNEPYSTGDEPYSTGDEPYSTGDECVENARLSFSHTHTHTHTVSCQRLPSRIYVEMIVIVTATYLRNGRYHIEEIQ